MYVYVCVCIIIIIMYYFETQKSTSFRTQCPHLPPTFLERSKAEVLNIFFSSWSDSLKKQSKNTHTSKLMCVPRWFRKTEKPWGRPVSLNLLGIWNAIGGTHQQVRLKWSISKRSTGKKRCDSSPPLRFSSFLWLKRCNDRGPWKFKRWEDWWMEEAQRSAY